MTAHHQYAAARWCGRWEVEFDAERIRVVATLGREEDCGLALGQQGDGAPEGSREGVLPNGHHHKCLPHIG